MCAVLFDAPQAVLSLEIPRQLQLADVHVGENAPLLQSAQRWLDRGEGDVDSNSPFRIVHTWGRSGCGKTLLAQTLSQRAAAYLNASNTPADFAAAHSAAAVVVDDIDTYPDALAVAAFDVFNAVRLDPSKRWWSTSAVPPAQMTGVRADVSSRMAWGLVFEMRALNEADSVGVMQAQAASLGFELSADSAQYLLMRLERNLSRLAAHLASLNHYALALKKPVNPYLVQQWYAQVYVPQLQKSLL